MINMRAEGNHKAQALVEVALTLPLILVLVLGAMDFGRLFFTKIVLTNAAREGANYLARNPDDKESDYIETLAVISEESANSGVVINNGDVEFENCCSANQPVKVTITKTMDLLFDDALEALGLITGDIVLTGEVEMVVQ